MTGQSLFFSVPNEADTASLGQALARYVSVGDVMLLDGPMGAGKTHLARALIQSILVVPEDVPSPSFALVQTYDTHRGPLSHFDLYRLDTADLVELGIDEALDSTICLIEWPDRLGDVHLPHALTLLFDTSKGDDARTIRLTWTDPHWNALKDIMRDV